MACRTRSLLSIARASAFHPSPPLSATLCFRLSHLSGPHRLHPRRISFSNPRSLGELGCAQSLFPLHSMAVGTWQTSHLVANVGAYCQLSHGTFYRSCQDP